MYEDNTNQEQEVQEVNQETSTKEELKEDTSITATGEEMDTTSEATNISQKEPEGEVNEPEKVETEAPKNEDTLKVAFIDQQKQLEEMRSQLDGQKKANEELISRNKALEEKIEKFEKDISELRESPFYKSSGNTADRKIPNNFEGYSSDDLRAFHSKI